MKEILERRERLEKEYHRLYNRSSLIDRIVDNSVLLVVLHIIVMTLFILL